MNQITNSNDKVIMEVSIGDKIFDVELETGACRSVISKKLYEKEFRKFSDCKQFSVLNGTRLDIVGYINAPLRCSDDNLKNTKIYMINTCSDFVAIIGRDALELLLLYE